MDNAMVLRQDRSGVPATISELLKIAELLYDSGLFPAAENAAGVFTIVQFGREIGLAPVTALKNISIVNGNLCMTAQVMLALALPAGVECDILRETITGCTVKLTRGDKVEEFSFDKEDAERVIINKYGKKLTEKDNWKNYPKDMYKWRAISRGLRVMAPDIVAGTYTPDEVGEIPAKPVQAEAVEAVVVEEDQRVPVPGKQTEQPPERKAAKIAEKSETLTKELVSPELIKAMHLHFTRIGLIHFRDEFKAYCVDQGWLKQKEVSFNTLSSTNARILMEGLEKHMCVFYSLPKYHPALKEGFKKLKTDHKRSVLMNMTSLIEDIDTLPGKISNMTDAFMEDNFTLFLTMLKNQYHNEVVDGTEKGMDTQEAIDKLDDLGMEPTIIETAKINKDTGDSSEGMQPGFF